MSTAAAHNAIVTLVTFYGAAIAEQQRQIDELQAKLSAANEALKAAGEQLRRQSEIEAELRQELAVWESSAAWKEIASEGAKLQSGMGATRDRPLQAEAMGQAGRAGANRDPNELHEVRSGQKSDEQHRTGESCNLPLRPRTSAPGPLVGRKKGS